MRVSRRGPIDADLRAQTVAAVRLDHAQREPVPAVGRDVPQEKGRVIAIHDDVDPTVVVDVTKRSRTRSEAMRVGDAPPRGDISVNRPLLALSKQPGSVA